MQAFHGKAIEQTINQKPQGTKNRMMGKQTTFTFNNSQRTKETLGLYMKSSFPKRDKRQIKKNEFVMPFCCVLNLFTAPSMFLDKSLYFLV